MVIIRATDDDGEEEEEDDEEEESPWTLQKLADLESQAEGLPRGEVLFIRPGNDTEIKCGSLAKRALAPSLCFQDSRLVREQRLLGGGRGRVQRRLV